MEPDFPKILPWLARKAGIPLSRAEVLWEAARCGAASLAGETGTPAYFSAAMDRLHVLIAAESLREDAAAFGWRHWSRHHRRAWAVPLAIVDALMLSSLRGWRTLQRLQAG